jgi:hypothetical protein
VFDYDDDGDLDVLIVNHGDSPALYRNERGNRHPWLRVRLQGTRGNTMGANARLRLWATPDATPQVREVQVGSNFLGQDEIVQHFGLGPHDGEVARLEVLWPGQAEPQVLENLPVRTTIIVRQP